RLALVRDEALGDAVVRLYERWSERLGADSDPARAAAVARAVAAVVPMDVDAIAGVLAPDIAFSDHRTLGVGSSRGAERYLRGLRGLLDLAADTSSETVDVLAASEHGLLLRRTRDGGARGP